MRPVALFVLLFLVAETLWLLGEMIDNGRVTCVTITETKFDVTQCAFGGKPLTAPSEEDDELDEPDPKRLDIGRVELRAADGVGGEATAGAAPGGVPERSRVPARRRKTL